MWDVPRSLAQRVDHWQRGKLSRVCKLDQLTYMLCKLPTWFSLPYQPVRAFAGRSTLKLANDPARSPRKGHKNSLVPATIPNRPNQFYLLVRSQDCPQGCLLEKHVWRCPQPCPTACGADSELILTMHSERITSWWVHACLIKLEGYRWVQIRYC